MSNKLGPKMARLNDRQRRFVLALFAPGLPAKGEGRHIAAARLAGLGRADGTSNKKTLTACACNLLQRPDVIAAIKEHARAAVTEVAPEAIAAVYEILAEKGHKDRARVAMGLIEKIDPTPRPPAVVIDQSTSVTMDAAGMIARIRALAGKHGLDADALMAGQQQLHRVATATPLEYLLMGRHVLNSPSRTKYE
jgi:hypothetical protein